MMHPSGIGGGVGGWGGGENKPSAWRGVPIKQAEIQVMMRSDDIFFLRLNERGSGVHL